MNEIEFPFDISDFTKKCSQMEKAVASIDSHMRDFGRTMSGAVARGIAKASAGIALVVGGFRSMMSRMPEIGQSFKVASDIVSREFLFPLRQQVVPLLQGMLDWVRDHRTLFAKWGANAAQVLKGVIDMGKTLWQTFQKVARVLVDGLQRGLKTTFKDLDEFILMLSLKTTTIALFLGDTVDAMFKHMSPLLEYVATKGGEIIGFFTDLFGSWASANSNGNSLVTVFQSLWNVLDKIVHMSLDNMLNILNGIKPALINLIDPIGELAKALDRIISKFASLDNSPLLKFTVKLLNGFLDAGADIISILATIMNLASGMSWGEAVAEGFKGSENRFTTSRYDEIARQAQEGLTNKAVVKGTKKADKLELPASPTAVPQDIYTRKVDDALIKDTGEVIKLNPRDNVWAFKDFPKPPALSVASPQTSVQMSMQFDVHVNEGNARAVGERLGRSIGESFVERLRRQQMAVGY